jgi:hypothetical protein
MNKNTKLIIYTAGAILGTVGVVMLVRKGKESDEEVEDVIETETKTSTPQVVVAQQQTGASFTDKKKTLQSIIGFTGKDVDGDIGNMTKAKLSSLGLTTEINVSNIDAVIQKAKEIIANTNAKQVAQATSTGRVGKAKALITAFNKQGTTKKATWIDDKASLRVYKKDVFGNFVGQSETINIERNKAITFVKAEMSSNGFLRLNLATNMWLVVSPYSLTIF